uniref:Formin 2 n=1 Tax=Strongyloides venezuelensis TaxID=75913 RepID=A0A0K0FFV1_STRVS
MDVGHKDKKDLMKELKEKVQKMNLPRKYQSAIGRSYYVDENYDKNKNRNTFPRMRYIYAFPEEIAEKYFGMGDAKKTTTHSTEIFEKKEVNYESYRLRDYYPTTNNKYLSSCPEIHIETEKLSPRTVTYPITVNHESPFSSNKSTYLASEFLLKKTKEASPGSLGKKSSLKEVVGSPYLKTLEDSLSTHFSNLNDLQMEEIKSRNKVSENDCSQHLWEKVLCFSDGNKKAIVKIENRMMINMNDTDISFIDESTKPMILRTISYLYEKIDKKVPLEWLDLYVIKTWNYSIILPLERKFFDIICDENEEKEKLGEKLNEKYCNYEDILSRIILKNDDLLALKAFLIMKGEAYKFHYNVIQDPEIKKLYLEKSIACHKELLNILVTDLNDDIGNIWRGLRYSMGLLRKSKSKDKEFIKSIQFLVNYFLEDKIFGKLCVCDQKKVLKYQQYLANLEE